MSNNSYYHDSVFKISIFSGFKNQKAVYFILETEHLKKKKKKKRKIFCLYDKKILRGLLPPQQSLLSHLHSTHSATLSLPELWAENNNVILIILNRKLNTIHFTKMVINLRTVLCYS